MKTILVTGGQRSGKSEFAERLALSLDKNPIYLATARIGDDEFRQRVEIHRQRRGSQWTTIEEEINLSLHAPDRSTILVDCVTLWASNCFFACNEDQFRAYDMVVGEFDKLTTLDSTFIFVTNETGMGGISADPMQRHFTDMQGRINQYIARRADEVYLLVSGIPVKIK